MDRYRLSLRGEASEILALMRNGKQFDSDESDPPIKAIISRRLGI